MQRHYFQSAALEYNIISMFLQQKKGMQYAFPLWRLLLGSNQRPTD